MPAESMQFGYLCEFSGCTVRFGRVECQSPIESDSLRLVGITDRPRSTGNPGPEYSISARPEIVFWSELYDTYISPVQVVWPGFAERSYQVRTPGKGNRRWCFTMLKLPQADTGNIQKWTVGFNYSVTVSSKPKWHQAVGRYKSEITDLNLHRILGMSSKKTCKNKTEKKIFKLDKAFHFHINFFNQKNFF